MIYGSERRSRISVPFSLLWSRAAYDARRRRAGRFNGVASYSDLGGDTFASSFRSRLALSAATRSVVGGRASTSRRWISWPATFCSIAFRSRFRYSSS
jgi:hypothetical protein